MMVRTLLVFLTALALLSGCSTISAVSQATSVDVQTTVPDSERLETVTTSQRKGESDMTYNFSQFTNVEITGLDPTTLTVEEQAVLYQQARYCQAMTEADTDTLRELVSEDATFTHMSGHQQTREEYFADIESGGLQYFSIGIENPTVVVEGDNATVAFTSVLNADAYGARGTYRIAGTHYWELRDGAWIAV